MINRWDDEDANIILDIDFLGLEMDPAMVKLTVPSVPNFKKSQVICFNKPFTVRPGEGLI